MRLRTIIPLVIVTIVIAIALVFGIKNKKDSTNDPYTVGNTAGNLNNSGLFCEKDGVVYFSNPNDGGSLYSMNPDETNLKLIYKASVESINADKTRIYYTLSGESSGTGLGFIRKSTGMYSIKKNGGGSIAYTQDPVGIVALSGNSLYYQHYTNTTGTNLDCISTNKKNNHKVVDNMVSPASVDSGRIYYSGASNDMNLYVLDTATDDSTVLYERSMFSPIYHNGYIYYIDLVTNYQLHRYNMSTGEDVTLTKERVDMFNVAGNMIYYQSDSSSATPALKRMTTDGEDMEVVSEGIYCDINITSNYVYFHSYDSKYPTYHTPLYGSVMVSVFNP